MPPDAETIALVSVVVTGVTAVGVPVVNAVAAAKADARRYRHEREARDLDELRDLLDDAALSISGYIATAIALESAHGTVSDREPPLLPHAEARLNAMRDAASQSHTLNRRLVIRLGREHRAVTALGLCLKRLDEAMGAVSTDLALDVPREKEDPVVLVARRMSWHEAHEHFLDVACELVGSPIRRS